MGAGEVILLLLFVPPRHSVAGVGEKNF